MLKTYYVCWDEKKGGTQWGYYTIVIAENQSEIKKLVRDRQNERILKGLSHMFHVHTTRSSNCLGAGRIFRERELLKLRGTALGKHLEDCGYDVRRIEEKYPHFHPSGVLEYAVAPESPNGYTVQVNPWTGESRHCGFGKGCFWTEWR